jgi:endonuclease/exonuclease/phosphatase family metal-dependent hydrolase
VATYNLYLGADLSVLFGARSHDELARLAAGVLEQARATDFPARAEAIAAVLGRVQPDVVGLQEVASWSSEDGVTLAVDFLPVLLEELARGGHRYDVQAVVPSFEGTAHVAGGAAVTVTGRNVVLVRRDPSILVTGEASGRFERRLPVLTGVPDLSVTVDRSWSWVDLEVGDRPLRFVNTHLEAWDPDVRDAQRQELLDALAGTAETLVVVGDFNAPPDRVGMPDRYTDAWAVAGRGDGATCGQAADLRGGSRLSARIDYVWVLGAEVLDCQVAGHRRGDRTAAGLWPSDHAAVVAELRL